MRSEVSGEVPGDLAEGLSVEKQQEQQLMNKLASQGRLPARPASSFLQKKLQQRVGGAFPGVSLHIRPSHRFFLRNSSTRVTTPWIKIVVNKRHREVVYPIRWLLQRSTQQPLLTAIGLLSQLPNRHRLTVKRISR